MNKRSMSPVEVGGAAALGKIMFTNALHRFGQHIPGIPWMGREIAGIGARTAMQGKPMLSAPLRHAASIIGDPTLVSLYENAHKAGTIIPKGTTASQVKGMIGQVTHNPDIAKIHPGLGKILSGPAAKFLDRVPLESKGVRKVIDYGFTPVGQVARDIKGGIGRVLPKGGVGGVLPKGVDYLPPGSQTV